jgi:dUTP pyrophosphatase
MLVKIKKLDPEVFVPQYATRGSAGFDLAASHDMIIESGETRLIKTGLAIIVPDGFEMQIRPRSGLSLKTGLRVANSPGTIDSDYRGEIGIILSNVSKDTYTVYKGDKIAQGVICPIIQAAFREVTDLDETARGQNGFGSTGVSQK